MKTTLLFAAAGLALAAAAGSAQAGCATHGKLQAGSANTIPAFIVQGLKAPATAIPPAPGVAPHAIVGTWMVTYTSGGAPGGQAFIQWHDDGTEFENINFPIEGGNICLGSWKPVDPLHVSRNHIGWLYTAGILSGYFTETETDHLTGPNTYIGDNDTKIYDLKGHVQVEFPGTASAVRLAP